MGLLALNDKCVIFGPTLVTAFGHAQLQAGPQRADEGWGSASHKLDTGCEEGFNHSNTGMRKPYLYPMRTMHSMPATKVTRRYQITIPREIRDQTDIEIGDHLTLEYDPETRTVKIHVPRKTRTPITLGRDVTPEEIDESIDRGFRECQR